MHSINPFSRDSEALRRGVVWLSILLLAGCSKPTTTSTATTPTPSAAIDFAALADSVRQAASEPAALRAALDSINDALSKHPERKPPALQPPEITTIGQRLQLADLDVTELTRAEFGPLDAHAVHEAFYLRDIARTLGDTGTPADRFKAATEWLVRHVRLEERAALPDPPVYVAQRGWGTSVERTYVMLALCQAMNLPAWAIGDETAGSDPTKLWGVVAKTPQGMMVCDTRLALVLPGTLDQLTKDPSPLLGWTVDAKLPYDVTPERLKSSKLFPGIAPRMLSPRMRFLQEQLKGQNVVLSADREATLAGMTAHWNTRMPGQPGRVLAEFLPREEGGYDVAPPGNRRLELYQMNVVPWAELGKPLLELPGPFGQMVQQSYRALTTITLRPGQSTLVREQKNYVESLRMATREFGDIRQRELKMKEEMERNPFNVSTEGGASIREQLLRGSYADALPGLVMIGDQLRPLKQQFDRVNVSQPLAEWVAKVPQVYGEYLGAQRSGDSNRIAVAEAEMEKLRIAGAPAMLVTRNLGTAQALEEIDRLIVIAKQDQAEANATDAEVWTTIAQQWSVFLSNHPKSRFINQARRLHARALFRAGKKEQAAAAYREVQGPERAAGLILAK